MSKFLVDKTVEVEDEGTTEINNLELPYCFQNHDNNSLIGGMVSAVRLVETIVHEDRNNSDKEISQMMEDISLINPIRFTNFFLDYEREKRDKITFLDMILKATDSQLKKEQNKKGSNNVSYSASTQIPATMSQVVEEDSVFNITTSKGFNNKSASTCKNCLASVVDCWDDDDVVEKVDLSVTTDSLIKLYLFLEIETKPPKKVIVLGAGDGAYVFAANLFSETAEIVACEWNSYWFDWLKETVDKYSMNNIKLIKSIIPEEITKTIGMADIVILTKRVRKHLSTENLKILMKQIKSGCYIVMQEPIEEELLLNENIKNEWEDKMKLKHRLEFCEDHPDNFCDLIYNHIIYCRQ